MKTDYLFEKPKLEDFDAIVQFLLDDFLVREPLLSSLGATREEALPLFTAQGRRGIDSGISYIVRSVPDGKIVGAPLTAIRERPSAGEQKDAFGMKEKPGPNVGQVHRFLSEFANKVWDLVPSDVNKVAHWMMLSVGKDFAGRGICQKLIQHNLDELKDLACQGAVTEVMAYGSQKACKNAGYEELYVISHKDWKDESGKQIFDCPGQADSGILAFKRF